MSDTPTPETDAELYPMNGVDIVWPEFARKLERERDEAQKELSSIHRWIERNHADGFIDSLTYFQNLERVTDSWYDRLDRLEVDAGRFEKERDEARAVAGELSDVASKYLSFLLAVTPAKTNETHEKETMRVIDAIKRWKKL